MSDKIARQIGKNILRLNAGERTYMELGAALNVSDSTISHWINGDRQPKAYALYRMAKLFNCTMEDLMKGVDNYE